MKLKFFKNQAFSRWICLMTITIVPWLTVWGQSGGESTTEELIRLGFENVRWAENETERIYTIENNVYKVQGIGIAKAIEVIQAYGLPADKKCKVIVTHLDIPQLTLTYQPTTISDLNKATDDLRHWLTSY